MGHGEIFLVQYPVQDYLMLSFFFHKHWKTYDESTDNDLLSFSNRRQQGESDLGVRDRVLRQVFFEYLKEKEIKLIEKDQKRAFEK